MQIAIVGLGKMGYNLALNLNRNKFDVVAYDISDDTRNKIASEGITTSSSLLDMAGKMSGRRVIWLMVPSGKIVDDTIEFLMPHISQEILLSMAEILIIKIQ